MPELPGPPAGYDEEQRRIWYEGAASVAKLQAQQWGIIADQYRKAAEGQLAEAKADDVDDVVQSAEEQPSGEEADEECPDCGDQLVKGFGGRQCPACGFTLEESDT